MSYTYDALIEELRQLINNCNDNKIVGVASVLLCLLSPDHYN
jgi:hypothetical protein